MKIVRNAIPCKHKAAKPHGEFRPLLLIPTLICRPNSTDEIFFLSLCSVCGLPITDFADANVCVVDPYRNADEYPSKFETVAALPSGAKLLRIPGEVVALHKLCDQDGLVPWKPMTTILRSDQRYEWEKPLPPTQAKRNTLTRCIHLNKLEKAA